MIRRRKYGGPVYKRAPGWYTTGMEHKREKNRNAVRWGLAVAGAGLVAAGLFWNGWSVVLHRAVLVCMECIGLG